MEEIMAYVVEVKHKGIWVEIKNQEFPSRNKAVEWAKWNYEKSLTENGELPEHQIRIVFSAQSPQETGKEGL